MTGWLSYPPEQLRKAPAGADIMQRAQDLSEQVKQVEQRDPGYWMTPPPYGQAGRPIVQTQLEKPLQFEYTPGINLIAQPRSGFGLPSFAQLRNVAKLALEIRLPIELLKREIRALDWDIVPRQQVLSSEERNRLDEEATEARTRLSKPDGVQPFDTWVNTLLEEVLVTDAATIYPSRTRGGDVGNLEIIDGTTIRPLLDARGRVPLPPIPAYVQTLHGVSSGTWTRSELWYLPYNVKITSPYGHPPVENIIVMVNTALRRAQSRLAHYTEGNVPEALVGLPAEWSIDQIGNFQEYWDALVAGDVNQLRRMKFFPVSTNGIPVHEFTRSEGSDTQLDEWLLRVGCWATGVSPAEFGLVPGSGLGGRGFADAQADVQYRMGLGPLAQYISGFLDSVLLAWGYEELAHQWTTLQRNEDAMQQSQVDSTYISAGVYDVAYVQDRMGIPEEQRPEAPPQPTGGGFFGLTEDGTLHKASEDGLGDDDPFLNEKADMAVSLGEVMIEYLQGLERRVLSAVERDNGSTS